MPRVCVDASDAADLLATIEGRRVAVVQTGSNVDREVFARVLEERESLGEDK
jgi:hypothetical protein